MAHDDGSLTPSGRFKQHSDRLKKIEDMHAQGGVCEQHQDAFWKEINGMKKSQYMLLGGLALMSVVGPILAELILKFWK